MTVFYGIYMVNWQRCGHRAVIAQGRVEDTRARGRSPLRWTDRTKSERQCKPHYMNMRQRQVERSGGVVSSGSPNNDDRHQSVKIEMTKKEENMVNCKIVRLTETEDSSTKVCTIIIYVENTLWINEKDRRRKSTYEYITL